MSRRVLTVDAHVALSGLPVEVLTFYRGLRKAGVQRRDANMMVAGLVMGADAGVADWTVLSVKSDSGADTREGPDE